jgi:hypothetical protein
MMRSYFQICLIALMLTQGCQTNNTKKVNKVSPVATKSEQLLQNQSHDSDFCKCEYFTQLSRQKIFLSRDSISKDLRMLNDTVIVFGFHYDFQKLLFIGNSTKKAFVFIMDSTKTLIPFSDQNVVLKLWNEVVDNRTNLKSIKDIPKPTLDNSFVYTISMFSNADNFDYCICATQLLLLDTQHHIKKMLGTFLEDVVNLIVN